MAENLGTRIRRARALKDMSQAELARRIGVSKNTMAQIEHGQTTDPGAMKIVAIAEVLGVSTDELLRGSATASVGTAEQESVVRVGREHMHPALSEEQEKHLNALAALKQLMEDDLILEVIREDQFDDKTKEHVIRLLMETYEHFKGRQFGNS
jgi:transcriptional regulator with XRE-family HTH domain